MKALTVGAVALAAMMLAMPVHAAEPEEAMGLERGKYGDPNALITVNFAFARQDLLPIARGMLEEFANTMEAGRTYELGGHTDSVGDEKYNQWLSVQRAEMVKKYLVNLGVDGAQLNVVGHGETQPTDTNRTRAGRQRNRRVVLKPQ
jgi:outer membrane protein OmpA-like peptidoglycan-associated protein